jgi:predicted RNA-binding Zn-ribbon protein involved in translation (DUF1610 family)
MKNLSFIEIADRHKYNEFPYFCSCGTMIGLKKRVTSKIRTCPQCGDKITVKKIDSQVWAYNEARKNEDIGYIIMRDIIKPFWKWLTSPKKKGTR